MGKNRKRLSGRKRRDIKKKWKARTFLERSSESSEEKDRFGDQMEEVGAAKASVIDLVDRVKWRLARMEERLSRGRGKVMSQGANKLQAPFLANSIYSRSLISKSQ